MFQRVIQIIPSFNITNPEILPYGLKPHTRSVSWIVEQVIVQQTKYNSRKLGLMDVAFDVPDTSLHDCVIEKEANEKFYVNIKITSTDRKNKNDISAIEKLYMQYTSNPSYRLIFVVFKFTFKNTLIIFNKDKIHAFSPQFLPIYVNPRNDKLQAYYYSEPTYRTRKEFLRILERESRSIILR